MQADRSIEGKETSHPTLSSQEEKKRTSSGFGAKDGAWAENEPPTSFYVKNIETRAFGKVAYGQPLPASYASSPLDAKEERPSQIGFGPG